MTVVGRHSPPDNTPTAKVSAGALAGAAVTVFISVSEYLGVNVPPDVAAAAVVLLSGLAAYFKKSRPGDTDL